MITWLMVQKYHSQPPFGCIKHLFLNTGIKPTTNLQLVRLIFSTFFHQQFVYTWNPNHPAVLNGLWAFVLEGEKNLKIDGLSLVPGAY